MDEKYIFNMIAMISLILIGIINIFQGLWYIGEYRIGKLPEKVKTIGIVNIIIGVVAFGFASMYGYFLLS